MACKLLLTANDKTIKLWKIYGARRAAGRPALGLGLGLGLAWHHPTREQRVRILTGFHLQEVAWLAAWDAPHEVGIRRGVGGRHHHVLPVAIARPIPALADG